MIYTVLNYAEFTATVKALSFNRLEYYLGAFAESFVDRGISSLFDFVTKLNTGSHTVKSTKPFPDPYTNPINWDAGDVCYTQIYVYCMY